jgi:hypothetical protein
MSAKIRYVNAPVMFAARRRQSTIPLRIRKTNAPVFRFPKAPTPPETPLLTLEIPSKDSIIQQQEVFKTLLLPPVSPARRSPAEEILGPCAVCYEDVCQKENVTTCLHVMCQECASQWGTGQCPVCRADISEKFMRGREMQEQVEIKRQLETKRKELLNYLTAYLYDQVAPLAERRGNRFLRQVNDLIYTVTQTDLEQVLDIDVLLSSDLPEAEIHQQVRLYLEPLFLEKYRALAGNS